MGLFGFGKKKAAENKGCQYRILFNYPFDTSRNQPVKNLALECLGNIGVHVSNVQTTPMGNGFQADFTSDSGDSITVVEAPTPLSEDSSSYMQITVKSNHCSEGEIREAFAEIKRRANQQGIFFTEY